MNRCESRLWTGVALVLSVGFTLAIGFYPTWLIDATRAAVATTP